MSTPRPGPISSTHWPALTPASATRAESLCGSIRKFWPSFLLGGICRTLAVRLGGECGYIAMKPFFFGLIFGDVAASGILLLIGILHVLITGQVLPITYQV